MTDLRAFALANGWPELVRRVGLGASRRLRDRLTSRQLNAPGFRAGRAPRLLGLSHVHVGPDFHAGDSLWLEAVLRYGEERFVPELRVGAHARLSDNVHIACVSRVTIGEHLLCGSGVLISDHAHGRYDLGPNASDPAQPPALRPLQSAGDVQIGDRVWIGDGAKVLAGAQIGDGAVIGANAVVTGSVPAETIAVGAPARPIRQWDREQQGWITVAPGERM